MPRTTTSLRRPTTGRQHAVSHRHDPAEAQADRAADVVARGGSVSGWSFGSVPVSATVHRQESGKPASDDEKLKEAAKKVGEAALETKTGKELQEKVKETPLVKKATQFLESTPGKIVAGGAIAAGAGALAAAKQPLPIQPPAIGLDRITPGLSAKVTVEGPLNAPTFVGLSLTYKEQGPKGKKGPTQKEQIAADIARLRAEQEMFKPQAQKQQEKADEQAAIAHVLAQQSKRFGSSTLLPLRPGDKPKTVEVPKQEQPEPRKDEEAAPVQRSPATDRAGSDAQPAGTSRVDAAVSGGGRPLEAATRRSMEARFGYDFGAVRVHDGSPAAAAASDLAARAFTVGTDIVFEPGRYDPATAQGRRLLAHELAHVVQQGGAERDGAGPKSRPGPAAGSSPEWRPGVVAPPAVRDLLDRPGEPLPSTLLASLPLGYRSLHDVRIHHGEAAARTTADLGAAAYTVGRHVVMSPDRYPPRDDADLDVLLHELGHVRQHDGTAPELTMRDDEESEATAGDPFAHPGAAPGVRRHPITKIGKWAAKKLAKKGTKKFISKHVAKHMRKIAAKSVHSVFLKPRGVKDLVKKTVEEAVQLGEKHAGAAASKVIEEGGVRVAQQATRTPGKFRLVIQKEFANAIGTKGERVLQIVLDQTGRIVTAFPRDGFKALGLTAAGIELLTSTTAEAAESVHASVEREQAYLDAAERAAQDDDSWVEWIPIVGDLYGGSLNAGEDDLIRAQRERASRQALVERTVTEVTQAVQEDLKQTLGAQDRADLREQVLMILTSGADVEAEPDEVTAP